MRRRPWDISYKEMRKFGLTDAQMASTNAYTKEQYSNNAWHEAAHAVVGDAVGLDAEFIDLTPHIEKYENGCLYVTAAQTKERQPTRQESISALNGDQYAIDLIERHFVVGMAGVVFDLQNRHFGSGMDIWDIIARAINLYHGDTEKCASVIRASAIRAATCLDSKSANLKALARKAMELQMMDRSEIETILRLDLRNKPIGFVKHADIKLLFTVGQGIEPRCQIGLLNQDPSSDSMTITTQPPYEVFVRLDESMVNEIVHRFDVGAKP